MRKIKFRAWDKERRQFYTSPLWVEFQVDLKGELTAKNLKRYGKYGKGYQQLTIIEYTGMRDMNDTEIWEGDIVQFNSKSKQISDVWKHTGGEWQVFDSVKSDMLPLCVEKRYITVIGNIYENPELLVSTDTKGEEDD